MSKEDQLIKNTAWLTVCSLINKGLLFVMIPFFSRWLSTEDYGTFDVLSTYVSLLIPILTLACTDAIFRLSIDAKEKQASYIFSGFVLFVFNLLIACVVIFATGVSAGWPTVIPFIGLLIGETADNFIQGYLRAIKKLNLYAIGKSINTILIIIFVTIFVLFCDLGLWGITFGYALGYLVGDVFLLVITKFNRYCRRSNFSFSSLKEMIRYSLPLIPNNISWWVVNVSDRTIINLFLGAAANGVYAIAYKIPNLCSAIFGVFGVSWQEAAIDALDDENRVKFYNTVYNRLLGIILSICIGILSCSYILFNFVFDVKYVEARLYAPILVTAIIITSLSTFFGGIQISLKQPGKNGISTVIGAVINVLINLALIKTMGLYAACISTVVSDFAVYAIRKYQLREYVIIESTKENMVWLAVFAVFFVTCYLNINLVMSVGLICIASILFIVINRDNIAVIVKTVKHRMKQ